MLDSCISLLNYSILEYAGCCSQKLEKILPHISILCCLSEWALNMLFQHLSAIPCWQEDHRKKRRCSLKLQLQFQMGVFLFISET